MSAAAARHGRAGQRLNLVISDEDQSRINRLSSLMDGATMTEVVKRSLKMNEFVLERIMSGDSIKVVDSDGNETVLAIL
jgi:hypothetical protein